MSENISFEFQKPEKLQEKIKEQISFFEKEFSQEEIKSLPDWLESCAFYRGVKVEDAIKAIFGKLNLNPQPENDPLGKRDNATLNLDEAIYFSRTSKTKDGKKFLCAIGFDPLPGSIIEKSYLKRDTFFNIKGKVIAKEIVLRFAGKEPGQPSKKVKYFSPKEFYQWCQKNL